MPTCEGQVYRCQNRECGFEIKVIHAPAHARATPRCCCGAEMKKIYRKPVFRPLGSDFEFPDVPKIAKTRN
jgi:predicted nucleic acid-binding Zn ribbon protein